MGAPKSKWDYNQFHRVKYTSERIKRNELRQRKRKG